MNCLQENIKSKIHFIGQFIFKKRGANYRLNLEDAIEDYSMAIETFSEKDSIYKADAFYLVDKPIQILKVCARRGA